MFILSYIYSVISILVLFIGSIFGENFWIFLISGIIFALLYTNLIILCKYLAIFINKVIKKEPFIKKEIYYLITSLIIFVTIGVVFTPIYNNINQIPDKGIMYTLETFLFSIVIYIFFMLMSSILSITDFFVLDFSSFLSSAFMAVTLWANLIILCKYLYHFIRKTIKKEPLTQKEIIYLITSIIIFVTVGVSYAFVVSKV